MKNKLMVLLTTFILTISFVVPAFAATTVTVDLSTDKVEYSQNSTITVSGKVLKGGQAGKGTNPLLQFINPDGQIIEVKQWTDSDINTAGNISTSIVIKSLGSGAYKLKLTAGGVTKTNEITISGGVIQTGAVSMSFDKSEYSPNEWVQINSRVLVNNQPAAKNVNLVIKKGTNVLKDINVASNTAGDLSYRYQLLSTAEAGTYTVTMAIVGMSATDTKTFTVKASTPTPTNPGTPGTPTDPIPPGPTVPPTNPEPPIDTVAAPFVNVISSVSTVITGKATAGTIIDMTDRHQFNVSVTTAANGTFKAVLPKKLKEGTILYVTAKNDKGVSSQETIVVVIDKTAPGIPTVNKVKVTSKTVSGKAEKGATVYVKAGKKVIGTAVVNSKGVFVVKIKNQKAGTTLVVYVKDKAGNIGKSKSVKVSK